MFNPLLILKSDTWYATYKDNKERYENPFNSSFNLTELKIDGKDRSDLLTLQGSNLNIITCYASEINLVLESDGDLMGTAPSEYFINNPLSFKLKPLDSNFYDENAYICCLFNIPEIGGVMGLPVPLTEAISDGYCTYNEEENSITATREFLQMLQSLISYPICAVLATINEETDEVIIYDTINESVSTPVRTITCLSNNVNILLDDYDNYYIDNIEKEYWIYNASVLKVKLTNNEPFKDKKLCLSYGINILGGGVLICDTVNNTISAFGAKYDTSTNTLDLSLFLTYISLEYGATNVFVFICDTNEDTDEMIIYDTIIETNGGFSPLCTYVFEDTNEHTVEFKTYDDSLVPTFTYSMILTELIMPDNITQEQIREGMFAGCAFLKKIKLSENITELNSNVSRHGFFAFCTSLESITLPKNISAIDGWCFYECTSLSSIRFEAIEAPMLDGEFTFGRNFPSTGTLYYPEGSDYSTWIEVLPSGWTTETFVP